MTSGPEHGPAPGPHSARVPALIRDWKLRYPPARRLLLAAGLVALCLLLTDPVRAFLRSFPGRWMPVLLVSSLFSLCLTPYVELLGLKAGAVDWPDRRKIHNRPTPRLGGGAIFIGLISAFAANGIWDVQIARLMTCASLLFLLGVAEDIRGVPARGRLAVQVILSAALIHAGLALHLFPRETLPGEMANWVLTILWMTGITNAFNFFDGMDGLASGLAILMAGFLGAIAFFTEQPQLGWVSTAILGACVGFLPYNFKRKAPAEIFLGDSGSTVLGFILAGLAVHGEWAVGHPLLNLAPPLLIFGVLIYDMVHTTVSRIARGDVRGFRQWLEYTGKDHLHHRLEALLRSKRKAVFTIFLLTFCLGLSALVIRHVSLRLALVLLLQNLVILLLVTLLEHAGNQRERRKGDAPRETEKVRTRPAPPSV